MKTAFNGSVVICSKHGKITGLDCCTLRNKKCKGCFIYDAVKNIKDNKNEKWVLGKANSKY